MNYLFVDAGCLQSMISSFSKMYFEGNQLEIDYRKLFQRYDKIFYYDCLPPQGNNELDEDYRKRIETQVQFFNSLRTIPGVHVYEGVTRRRTKTWHQKKVDVMITVDMLTYAFRRIMRRATLLTGDLDFKPLFDALVQDGLHVRLWCPENDVSEELKYAADDVKVLDFDTMHSYATRAFLQRFPKPFVTSQDEKRTSDCTKLNEWTTGSGTVVEFYQDENGYQVVFQNPNTPSAYIHIIGKTIELVKLGIENSYPNIRWFE